MVPEATRREQMKQLIVSVTDIHDEKARKEFMAKELMLPLDNLMWKVYLIQDYSEKESAIVYKCHHIIKDDIARLFKSAQVYVPPKSALKRPMPQ